MSSGVKKMTGGVKKRTGDVKMLERSGLSLFQNQCHVPAMQCSIVHTLDLSQSTMKKIPCYQQNNFHDNFQCFSHY